MTTTHASTAGTATETGQPAALRPRNSARDVLGASGDRAAFRTILVPLDGSRFSRAALAAAQALAARLDATLVLVRVVTPASVPGIDRDLAMQLGETDARRSLRETVEEVRATGLAARDVIATGGASTPPHDAILALAAELRPGLIVMATHGRTGFARAMLGSVADEVVARSPVPVLLVRPQFGAQHDDGATRWLGRYASTLEASRRGLPIEPLRVLMGIDGSPETDASVPAIAALVQALGADLSLVRVVAAGLVTAGHRSSLAAAEAARQLQRLAGQLRADVRPARHVRTAVRFGIPAAALLDQAARERASILALATHARRGLTRAMLGSVTGEIVARATLPILVVRSPGTGD